MKKRMFEMMLLLCGVCFFAENIFAKDGDRVGNGGDVVVCGDKVELLDVYEAKLKKINFIHLNTNQYDQMLKELLEKKLKKFQPEKFKKLISSLATFEEESQILPGIHLNDVDDSGLVAIPKGCQLEQIIIQLASEDIPPGGTRYTVNLDLWERLDEFNKMALTLHELLYRMAIEKKSASSMIVRAMVGELLGENLNLINFLKSDAVLMKGYLEIGTTDVISSNYGRNVNLSVSKNNYGEEQIVIEDKDGHFEIYYREMDIRIERGSKAILRLSDSMPLSIFTDLYDAETETTHLLRKGDWEKVRYVEEGSNIFLSSDKDILVFHYRRGYNEGTRIKYLTNEMANFTVKVENLFSKKAEKYFLQNAVKGLENVPYDYYTLSYLSGFFDLEIDGIQVSNKALSKISFTSFEKEYDFMIKSEEFISYKNNLGEFFCKKFGLQKNALYPRFMFGDCDIEKTTFQIGVQLNPNRKINFKGKLTYYDSGLWLPMTGVFTTNEQFSGLNLELSQDVYLGKTKGLFSKDIYLRAGNSLSLHSKGDGNLEISEKYIVYPDGKVKIK